MKQSSLEIINDGDKNHLTEYSNAREWIKNSKYSNNNYKVKDTLEGQKCRTQNVWILLKLSVIEYMLRSKVSGILGLCLIRNLGV